MNSKTTEITENATKDINDDESTVDAEKIKIKKESRKLTNRKMCLSLSVVAFILLSVVVGYLMQLQTPDNGSHDILRRLQNAHGIFISLHTTGIYADDS